MEKIVSLCKRRGFVFAGSEIYGGLANSWDYGPLGVELKNSIKKLWWQKFVVERDDMVGMDGAVILNPKVWEASGHTGAGFADLMIECKKCHSRFRADHLGFVDEKGNIVSREDISCPECGKEDWTEPKQFNLMFKTNIGPTEEKTNMAYLRPETAQAMFVNFKNILDTTRKTLPFGMAQIGKAFRNEITPGNFIFRTREFEQMEIEYFIEEPNSDKDWQKHFEYWVKQTKDWMELIGINLKKVDAFEVPDNERAHYSKRTVDFMYEFPFGKKELYGLAYRTDFDLKNHEKFSGQNLKYKDQETGKEFWPHVIEPSFGVERSFLAILCEAYQEDPSATLGASRVYLKLKPYLAPYQAAVFPLLANKPQLVAKAREVYDSLKNRNSSFSIHNSFNVAWDERGNIGKRYYSQDEIGTPYCVTIDFDTLENNTVTVRDRDTAKQVRVLVPELKDFLTKKIYS
ncbi:TPA: glycine--tRNA ligase [Patescibacteria group bacterium]|nr:glycine--tRNA ligase [Patescibacteria group bacterium]